MRLADPAPSPSRSRDSPALIAPTPDGDVPAEGQEFSSSDRRMKGDDNGQDTHSETVEER